MQIGQALRDAKARLQAVSATPRLDAELLLGAVLNRDRAWLLAHDNDPLDSSSLQAFENYLVHRAQGEPVAYLLGMQEFWSLPLQVNRHTLIPRPDTEVLVETTLRLAPENARRILDLGTGTGAIALALQHERPDWQVVAVDRIAEAVALAKCNAERLALPVECLQSDWFNAVSGCVFDVIVSNPPYIDPLDRHLQGDGVKCEPLSALVAEQEGLADLQKIVGEAPKFLINEGLLAVEHGHAQGEIVRRLFEDAGFCDIQTHLDYGGQPRVTSGIYCE